jgi:hypothetical protein
MEGATMNWRLIAQLSLFGLAMGLATVYFIPSTVEPLFWLAVFLVSAYLIATRAPQYRFRHGLYVGMANSLWVIGCHVGLFGAYASRHAREMAMMTTMPLSTHPRVMMIVSGLVIGVVSGALLGLLSLGAARLVTKRAAPAPA